MNKYDNLASENLASMLRKDVGTHAPGKEVEPDTHDYSHVLEPRHQAAGYSLHVMRLPHLDEGQHQRFDAVLQHQGREVGSASGCSSCGVLGVDTTTIKPEHRGKGLGVPMYEALMAHGKHMMGTYAMGGGKHSTSASRVHQSLSRRHGFSYTPERVDHNPEGEQDANFGPYRYAYKSELRTALAGFAKALSVPSTNTSTI